MGKTKTAFVSDTEEKRKKPSKKQEKVHIAGLKGGQKIKVIEAETAETQKEESQTKKKIKAVKQRSKKYSQAKVKIDKNKFYSLSEAISLLKEISYTKFDSTLEMHLIVKKTGLTANTTFPHSFGKEKKIEIANETTIEKLKKGKIDFDVLLSTPEMMPKLVIYAKLLGPKGLMPNPKTGTLIKTEAEAKKFSTASTPLKTESQVPLIHTAFGKLSQKPKELEENANAIMEAINKKQIIKAYIKSTMSPSIKLNI